jgi:hypothetical protein
MREKLKIIFLDIDGVLNSSETIRHNHESGLLKGDYDLPQKQFVDRVNRIIIEATAKVVISSSWRYQGFDRVSKTLYSCGLLPDSIIGMTPLLSGDILRGQEIQEWLSVADKEYDIERIVILDDDSDMGDLMLWLVQTSFQTGILDQHVSTAILMLNGDRDGTPFKPY